MKIICFGDSLTRGVSFINGRLKILKKNYPKVLQELFLHNNKIENDVLISNKGVFNDNSDLLLKRLDRDIIQERPNYVIIEIGGNDCAFQWSKVATQPNDEHDAIVPLDRYINNLNTIVTRIKAEGIIPILSTLPPLDPVRYYERITGNFSSQVSNWICRAGGIEHWHGQYNRSIRKIAEELGVISIDVRSAIKKAGDLKDLISDDGIHLTESGYKVFATEVFLKLSSIMGYDNSKIIIEN